VTGQSGADVTATDFSFPNDATLEFDANGKRYDYRIQERAVPNGIQAAYVHDGASDTHIITNTYPEDRPVNIRVEWDHTGAPAAERPVNATVEMQTKATAPGDWTPYRGGDCVLDGANGTPDAWTKSVPVPRVTARISAAAASRALSSSPFSRSCNIRTPRSTHTSAISRYDKTGFVIMT
jgi:hypothetical protein